MTSKWITQLSTENVHRPNAVILHGPPGIGKTSFAAQFPNVGFLVDTGEQGVFELKDSGLINKSIPVFPPMSNFKDTLEVLEDLRTGEHQLKALAIDSLGGFERLCHEHVCLRDYAGKWGKNGFSSYMQGFEVSLADWRLLLGALDRLRDERNMTIMLLGHTRVSPFRNPEGADYDRYNVDIHQKTWSVTHRWASMVLFANYHVAIEDENQKKSKARGGDQRILYTEFTAAYDAKNRHNLPSSIDMGSSAADGFTNFVKAVKAGKQKGN